MEYSKSLNISLLLCVPLKVTVSDTVHPTLSSILHEPSCQIVGKVLVVVAFFLLDETIWRQLFAEGRR
jgi:hypothetical protein